MQAYLYLTSVREIPLSTLQIYPNPVEEILNIDRSEMTFLNQPVPEVSIYDLAGRMVEKIPLQQQGLNVKFLQPGFYHIKLRAREKVYFGSFIKN